MKDRLDGIRGGLALAGSLVLASCAQGNAQENEFDRVKESSQYQIHLEKGDNTADCLTSQAPGVIYIEDYKHFQVDLENAHCYSDNNEDKDNLWIPLKNPVTTTAIPENVEITILDYTPYLLEEHFPISREQS